MTEFTKGKWVYDEPFGVIFSYETCAVIANVQGAGTGSCFCFTQEGQANARLIAAAPDMYDELVYILGYLYEAQGIATNTQYKHKVSNDIKRIEALIARIDGNDMKGGEA